MEWTEVVYMLLAFLAGGGLGGAGGYQSGKRKPMPDIWRMDERVSNNTERISRVEAKIDARTGST